MRGRHSNIANCFYVDQEVQSADHEVQTWQMVRQYVTTHFLDGFLQGFLKWFVEGS